MITVASRFYPCYYLDLGPLFWVPLGDPKAQRLFTLKFGYLFFCDNYYKLKIIIIIIIFPIWWQISRDFILFLSYYYYYYYYFTFSPLLALLLSVCPAPFSSSSSESPWKTNPQADKEKPHNLVSGWTTTTPPTCLVLVPDLIKYLLLGERRECVLLNLIMLCKL